ncbi:MAG TPA: TadE family protein [Candidatus Limnocylindria bacterium]
MSALRSRLASVRRGSRRGQATLEMALILPVLLLIVLGTLEFGFVMDHKLTLQYASREAARVGAALATGGGSPGCNTVDNEIIAAAQRILESSDSNLVLTNITDIRIFRSDLGPGPDGREDIGGDPVNVWHYTPGLGPSVDGVPLDFSVFGSVGWNACSRINTGATPDVIGVSVRYTYQSQTPLAALINLLNIQMADYTTFELNPTGS